MSFREKLTLNIHHSAFGDGPGFVPLQSMCFVIFMPHKEPDIEQQSGEIWIDLEYNMTRYDGTLEYERISWREVREIIEDFVEKQFTYHISGSGKKILIANLWTERKLVYRKSSCFISLEEKQQTRYDH